MQELEPPTVSNLVSESDSHLHSSPIESLHCDLIWSIFALNIIPTSLYSSPESPLRPLTIARRTSQVCHAWREVILSSSSLWGRLIDLDLLDQENRHWADEILRRTDAAPLWITGNVRSTRPSESFFFSLLDRDWGRIQKLDVKSHGIHKDDLRWNAFLLPAPKLELFNVRLPRLAVGILRNPPHPVFANHAPSLRYFMSNQVPYPVDAPWLPQIHSIAFPEDFRVPQILDLCSRTPRLVKFFANIRTSRAAFSTTIPRIHLPFLTSIYFDGEELGPSLQLLDHISASPRCLLTFETVDRTRKSLTPAILESAPEIISRWAMNCIKNYVVTQIEIEQSPSSTSFVQGPPTSFGSDGTLNRSIFSARFYIFSGPPEANLALIRAFVPPPTMLSRFSTISELSVQFLDISRSSYPAWMSFFDALPSVEVIKAAFYSIPHLLSIENIAGGRTPKFPALHTLEILMKGIHNDQPSQPIDLWEVLAFLKHYRSVGKPVALLKLTDNREDGALNINLFDEMEGLRLQWQRGTNVVERICGKRQ